MGVITMSELQDLLERLSNAHGASGYEGNVRQIIEDEVKPYVDEVRIDKWVISSLQNGEVRLLSCLLRTWMR
jgi:putative aminopeptidase FrvX